MEEITIEAGMKKDCITQGEADITSKQSEYTRNTENTTTQRRISAKMRKETLGAYKQTFLFPIKLSDRKAPPSESRETQERVDFIMRRLDDRDSNLSSFVENIICQHLEKYGEDIGKWRRL